MKTNAARIRVPKPIPIEYVLWTTDEIGAYLKVSPNKVVERYASQPGFPKRIEIPTAEGRVTHPRWKAIEVIEWVNGYAA